MEDYGLIMRVRREPAGHAVVTVAGELDIVTAPLLRDRLTALADSDTPLVVDLDKVSFIDAAGLGALVSATRQAVDKGSSLHVVVTRQLVRRLFSITRLDQYIPLARTVAEALTGPSTIAEPQAAVPARALRPPNPVSHRAARQLSIVSP